MILSAAASAQDLVYVVKKGDTISKILSDHQLKPIYGSNGTFKTWILFNPNLSHRKKYKIFPGEKIRLHNSAVRDEVQLARENQIKPRDLLRRLSAFRLC